MTPTKLLELFRLEADDLAKPYLWSDEEFYIYLNEAQTNFVREIGGLSDRRSSLTTMSYKTGDKFKKYDPRILRISGAQDETKKFIGIKNLDNLDEGVNVDDYNRRYNTMFADDLTGPIQFLLTDVDAKEIQLYPVPDHDGSLRIYIKRLPLKEIVDEDSVLELDEQHHMSLLCWVKYKAYLKQDVETFDGTKAAEYRKMFDEATQLAKKEKSAREDRKRKVKFSW